MELVINQHGWGIIIYLILIAIYYGVPIWAVVTAARNLRGGLRVMWIVVIVAATVTIPLIGLLLAVVFLALKRRFVAIQR
jgi:hypothetical protein